MRLCPDCTMPLVVPGSGEIEAEGPEHEQARKIHPRFARGELVRVAVARNLSEGELIKGVLLEQGIPSMLRRTSGFDVPDFLAAGPRDVLVPESGVEEARSLLSEVEVGEHEIDAEEDPEVRFADSAPLKIGAWLLVAVLLFGALAGVVFLVGSDSL